MMTEFIESLKRLYKDRMIADAVLKRLLESKKISNDELNYIKGKEE
jgi:hypothetical protein|nr:MAG TPA: hypothetical protein [Caudoviricetes sp.]